MPTSNPRSDKTGRKRSGERSYQGRQPGRDQNKSSRAKRLLAETNHGPEELLGELSAELTRAESEIALKTSGHQKRGDFLEKMEELLRTIGSSSEEYRKAFDGLSQARSEVAAFSETALYGLDLDALVPAYETALADYSETLARLDQDLGVGKESLVKAEGTAEAAKVALAKAEEVLSRELERRLAMSEAIAMLESIKQELESTDDPAHPDAPTRFVLVKRMTALLEEMELVGPDQHAACVNSAWTSVFEAGSVLLDAEAASTEARHAVDRLEAERGAWINGKDEYLAGRIGRLLETPAAREAPKTEAAYGSS